MAAILAEQIWGFVSLVQEYALMKPQLWLTNCACAELYEEKLTKLGPDPLREDADKERLWEVMQKSKKSIGQLLMDQTAVAGIGNIYRAEILFKVPLLLLHIQHSDRLHCANMSGASASWHKPVCKVFPLNNKREVAWSDQQTLSCSGRTAGVNESGACQSVVLILRCVFGCAPVNIQAVV